MSQSHKVKHVIIEPKDLDQIGEDYVGALIPNSSRPLGELNILLQYFQFFISNLPYLQPKSV